MSSNAVADEPVRKLALALGFLALAGSALVAHRSPATGYELSIYTMTPSWVWAGLGIALTVSLAVAFDRSGSPGSYTRPIALVLGGLAVIVVAGLPIVRGYHFFGQQDALTHLGWARGVSQGSISPFDLLYPGIHMVAVFINSLVEIPLTNALLLVVLIATIAFVVFVPLSVGLIVPDSLAVTIATFGAFLLLPVTTIATFMQPHAMTQSILLFALFVYVMLKYLTRDAGQSTALAVVFALVSAAAVVYHPQYAAHMLVVCLSICGVQFLLPRLPYFSRTAVARRIGNHQRLYGQALFLLAAFLAWSENHSFFAGFAGRAVSSALAFLLIGTGDAGTSISQQGGSLAAIGVSMREIFIKLFLPHLVITLLATVLILAVIFTGRPRRFPDVTAATTYLAAGLLALGGLFVIYFTSTTSEMYFRVFGLMMVFAVILASITVYEGLHLLSDWLSPTAAQTIVAGAFAALLVLSLLSIFASPYVYRQSQHVSEQQLHGYETAFDNAADGTTFAGFRGAPNRYADALNGQRTRTRAHTSLTSATFEQGPADYYSSDRYLVVSQLDYERELVAYRGLRYSDDDFAALAATPSINRVQSNGEFDTYYVPASDDTT